MCDKRSTRSEIAHKFPQLKFEEEFEEDDLLWTPESRESLEHSAGRARAVLDYVFKHESTECMWCYHDVSVIKAFTKKCRSTVVSITAHGGIISAFLRVLGRPNNNTRPIPTGGKLATTFTYFKQWF